LSHDIGLLENGCAISEARSSRNVKIVRKAGLAARLIFDQYFYS
jgi:hypothetical protein